MVETNRKFTVTYSSGETVIVKQTSWKNLDDLSTLCYALIQELVAKEGEVSEVLSPSNTAFWSNARKLSNLLPLVGSDEKLDLEQIDDMDQIIDIFLCSISSIDATTGMLNKMEPCQVCRIHSLNFFKLIQKAQENLDQPKKTKHTKT